MQQSYHHLSSEERAVIQVCRAQGQSLGAIAPALGRSASTVSRELSKMPAQYNATDAAKIHLQRRAHSRRKKKMRDGTPLFTKVRNMLECRQCSPEKIADQLKLENPDDPSMHLSHESIYRAIYAHPRNALKKLFISQLGRAKAKRGTRRSGKPTASIQLGEERRIHARPQAIETRLTPGHWEGGLIMGAANRSAVGTVVERKTGFVLLCKLASKETLEVRTSFERQLAKIDSFMRLSMAYDRGCEMAQHALMSARLKMHIYFADPHSPWQRGSNENINGLTRQYLPKGTGLSGVSQTRLNDIACLLNTRARKRLGWDSPQDRFLAEIEYLKNGVALEC